MSENEPLWTHVQTAEFLNVSIWQLYYLGSKGDGPPAYRLGKNLRYDPAEVRQWLRGHRWTGTSR